MFRNKKYKYITLALILVFAVTVSATAFAAGQTKTANLYYNGISVVLDGNELTLTSADGKTIEPFIIDGTTYLPVRAIGEALGLNVKWNSDSQTVYLSSDSTDISATGEMVDMSTLDAYSYSDTYDGLAYFSPHMNFCNRQEGYDTDNMLYGFDGRMALGWTESEAPSTRYVTYLLDGEYTAFQAYAASIDNQGSTVFTFINGDTNKTLKSVTLASGDKPVQISLNVTGIDKLKITYTVAAHKFFNSGYYYVENNGALYNAYLIK